jgi:hypothetical protein
MPIFAKFNWIASSLMYPLTMVVKTANRLRKVCWYGSPLDVDAAGNIYLASMHNYL